MKNDLRHWIVICAFALMFGASAALAQDGAGDLLGRINALRASLGRAGYSVHPALAAAAQSQAQWIVETGSVSHTRPDGSGVRTRAANAGYPSQQVTENIYGGSNATVNDAWTFWVNSGVHYNSMVNPNYNEIGIGIARGSWGTAFVVVFGSQSGGWTAPQAAAAPSGGGGGGGRGASANNAPPSFVLGLDARGNIRHSVQPGDTLGDIALIYGYGWSDIPTLMALNNMTDVRDLIVGSEFLVPPKNGTFTPTVDPNTPTPSYTPSPIPPTITPFVAQREPTSAIPTPVPTLDPTYEMVVYAPATILIPTAQPTYTPSSPPTQAVTQIAALPTAIGGVAPPSGGTNGGGLPMWIVIALGVQGILIIGAGIEFARRWIVRGKADRSPRGDYFTRRRR
jgi:hypothetical protein